MDGNHDADCEHSGSSDEGEAQVEVYELHSEEEEEALASGVEEEAENIEPKQEGAENQQVDDEDDDEQEDEADNNSDDDAELVRRQAPLSTPSFHHLVTFPSSTPSRPALSVVSSTVFKPMRPVVSATNPPFTQPRSRPYSAASTSSSSPSSSALLSLSVSGRAFARSRTTLTSQFYSLFNHAVFEDKLPSDMKIEWAPKLRTTAGSCVYTKVSV